MCAIIGDLEVNWAKIILDNIIKTPIIFHLYVSLLTRILNFRISSWLLTDLIKTIEIFDYQTLIRLKLVNFNVSKNRARTPNSNSFPITSSNYCTTSISIFPPIIKYTRTFLMIPIITLSFSRWISKQDIIIISLNFVHLNTTQSILVENQKVHLKNLSKLQNSRIL